MDNRPQRGEGAPKAPPVTYGAPTTSPMLPSTLPSNLKLQTLGVVALTLLSLYLIISSGVVTVDRVNRVSALWHDYTEEAISDGQRLHQVLRHFGYGGFIHNFKNYVLRHDASRVPLIERDLRSLNAALDALERSVVLHDAELSQLRAVVDEYEGKFQLARRLVAEGHDPRRIDALVKVDDTPALAAIERLAQLTLEHGSRGQRATAGAIAEAVERIRHGALLVIPLIIGAGGVVIVVLFRLTADIRRRQLAEEALRQAQEESQVHRERLAHLTRVYTVGEMASGIAHEINQPLAAIGGYARAAIRRIEREPPEWPRVRELLTKIDSQATRAADVITRLRAMIKREPSHSRPTDINQLIRDSAALAELECRRRGAHLKLMLGRGLPPVTVDPVQLEQVTLNLIRNALDASTDSDHPDADEVAITTRADGDGGVEVTVADRGHGIDHTLGEEVFHAFVTTKESGLGVGLAICSTLLEAFGGAIRHAPNPGGGTRFHYTLPSTRPVE